MTEFIIYIATSLDGYIARSDESIDWLNSTGEEIDQDTGYTQFYESIDALVMGYSTYEQVLGFGDWPYPGKLSYVLTNQNLSTTTSDVIFIKSLEEVIEEIIKRGHRLVWLVGGGKVISPFIRNGLVDEYHIFLIPIILGSGISLYQSLPEVKLQLIETKSYSSGVVELHYRKISL
jgi:dihydrofolate reductase